MKTKLLKRLRRKANRKYFVRVLNCNQNYYLVIARWFPITGYEYLQRGCYLWTSEDIEAQWFYNEKDCVEKLDWVRRRYILDCLQKINFKQLKRKINKMKY